MTGHARATGNVVAVDAGKTKVLAGVFTADLAEVERHRVPTTTTDQTVGELKDRLTGMIGRHEVRRIGLAVFGPLETDANHPEFGTIVGSSEPQWSGLNLPRILANEFAIPVYFDVDVNAGALAEGTHREGGHVDDFVYLSIGTGVGGAFYSHREAGRRRDPPQLGHTYLPREPDDSYPGSCPFHGSCLQGLASGKALMGRWRMPAHDLPAAHPAWDLEARYVARACANLLYVSSATTILVGSGVSSAPGLIDRANRYLDAFLNGFPENVWRRQGSRERIKRANTAPDSSLIGAAVMAKNGYGLEFKQMT
ncbi:ROK family protein [Actinophytocola sp.]|uniref:ROK family protein n=1 Tax=Actinophytocola sp. TaxID=1872138 RepID=UPI003D6A5F9F